MLLMDKNIKLIYCIVGSAILALLSTPIFDYAQLGMFPGGYGGNIFGELIVRITDIVSLAGFILLILFSIVLIVNNISFKK